MTILAAVAFLVVHACSAHARPPGCEVSARTKSGTVCGLARLADDGVTYASFRGVPYAKQPVGELRFKELEPHDPWLYLDAKTEGPICYQTDVLYDKIINQTHMKEACIHANIHVPMKYLPRAGQLQGPGLPILVFIHGGGFAFGSGDADLHGPEYLVSKNVIVITFNYRLNVFGFLSLNTTEIPGNAGLRDMVTLLRWVQDNAEAFGGDPSDVTLAGQSAGAAAAHLLTLSEAANGLFKRAILMSGTATSSFYSSSPIFAQYLSKQLLAILGITSTDPADIHRQLLAAPAETLRHANAILLENIGLTTFVPTVESRLPGVTIILDDYPDILIANGRGKNIPLLVGFTSSECETFRNRFESFELLKKIEANPAIIVPPKTLFMTPPKLHEDLSKKIDRTYYNGTINMDNFIKYCSEGFYEYAALKVAEGRAEVGGADVFLYQFSYEGQSNVIKNMAKMKYMGVGHIEDLTYIFRTNSFIDSLQPSPSDVLMKNLMTDFFVNFMTCSKPICEDINCLWPASTGSQYEDIESPVSYQVTDISPRQREVIKFFDSINGKTGVK